MDLVSKFNWIDLIAFIILVRILYIAVRRGFVVEFFKCIATFLSLSFSFHFFTDVADFLLRYIAFLSDELALVLSFLALYSLVWILIKYIRTGIILLFKIEPHAVIERWIGLFLGILRGIIFLSIFFFTLYLFDNNYLNKSLNKSFSFPAVKQSAPTSYRMMCSFYKKFLPELEPNERIDKIYGT